MTILPFPYGGYATAIDNQNMIVGTSASNSSVGAYAHAHLYNYNTQQLTDLGTLINAEGLPGLTSSAMDINELNQVVGSSSLVAVLTSVSDPTKVHAFLWENGAMTDLNSVLPADSGWILNTATAINDNGEIVGTGLRDTDGDGVLEPHGFLLMP